MACSGTALLFYFLLSVIVLPSPPPSHVSTSNGQRSSQLFTSTKACPPSPRALGTQQTFTMKSSVLGQTGYWTSVVHLAACLPHPIQTEKLFVNLLLFTTSSLFPYSEGSKIIYCFSSRLMLYSQVLHLPLFLKTLP
jgi:hypothetical protein